MSRRPTDQRGSGSVLALALIGFLLFVGLALSGCVALVVDHRRAQSAADLAALAGAAADGCDAADRIARANHALLVDCVRDGPDAVVRVSVASRPWLGWEVSLTAQARAGPG